MKAEVYSHDKLIGTTELQIGDESMGHLYGIFIPNNQYSLFVQSSMQQFWQQEGNYYHKLNSLNLSVRVYNRTLNAVGGITIEEFDDLPDEPRRIDIAGVDISTIEQYITKL